MEKKLPSKQTENLIGKSFSWMTVLDYSHSNKGAHWICLCKCGNKKIFPTKALKRKNRTISCGCSRKEIPKKRFYSLFDKSEGCWIWKGKLNTGGYGKYGYNTNAHRKMYEYEFGPIPKGMQVCHTCDVRKCVNPDHLFLGTITDNQKDKVKKNRQAKGSQIANSILTEEIVLEVRKMRLAGNMYKKISEKFKISWDLVKRICQNTQWKHVPLGEETRKIKRSYKNPLKGSQRHNSKLTEEQVKEIRSLLNEGKRLIDIAKQFNISISNVCDIRYKRTWSHV